MNFQKISALFSGNLEDEGTINPHRTQKTLTIRVKNFQINGKLLYYLNPLKNWMFKFKDNMEKWKLPFQLIYRDIF